MPKSANCLIFDVEATGLDSARDQIIEISILEGLSSDAEQHIWRVKPTGPISADAQAVHGISVEDLKDCPSFSKYTEQIEKLFSKAEVIIGYNVEFDLAFLQAEMRRHAKKELSLEGKSIVDPFLLWRRMEPRSLRDAHLRFVGKELEDAHSADQDALATGLVR